MVNRHEVLIDDKDRHTTPHAPCTPNWMQKAPAEREENEEGNIHKGMKALENINLRTIDIRGYTYRQREE